MDDKTAVRRIARKAQEVAEAPPEVVDIAARLLGCGTGIAELTTAICMGGSTQVLADLERIAGSDPMEAAIIAVQLERSRLKAVWVLAASLSGRKAQALPGGDGKAGLAVAKTVIKLGEAARARLAAATTLVKK
ncbi:MAG: hypothetical protein ACRCYU_23415 [Nocardioides sp.]